MAYKTKYKPLNESKYVGDPTNIICRSLWERKVCKYLDTNKNIRKWGSEELSIPYISPVDRRRHLYYPDFIVEVVQKGGGLRTKLIEVKPYKQTQEPVRGNKRKKTYLNECATYLVNTAKWDAAKNFCKKNNWDFVIMTEKDLFQ
tara:strand:+ start:570 stop:1004 length:435 start_codon:yes stop_codon:yes gene_type:complete